MLPCGCVTCTAFSRHVRTASSASGAWSGLERNPRCSQASVTKPPLLLGRLVASFSHQQMCYVGKTHPLRFNQQSIINTPRSLCGIQSPKCALQCRTAAPAPQPLCAVPCAHNTRVTFFVWWCVDRKTEAKTAAATWSHAQPQCRGHHRGTLCDAIARYPKKTRKNSDGENTWWNCFWMGIWRAGCL